MTKKVECHVNESKLMKNLFGESQMMKKQNWQRKLIDEESQLIKKVDWWDDS